MIKKLLLALFSMSGSAMAISLYSFSLLPGSDQSALPGNSMTWQLQIDNNTPYYLEIDDTYTTGSLLASEGSFDNTSFTFPIVDPFSSFTDPNFWTLTWQPTATYDPAYATSGTFEILSSLCDDNVGSGCDSNGYQSLNWSAAVDSPLSSVPEPATFLLLPVALALGWRRLRLQA